MTKISIFGECLRPSLIEQVNGSNFWDATYHETDFYPLFENISGRAIFADGDDCFNVSPNGLIITDVAGNDYYKGIISGKFQSKILFLRWKGRPETVYVDYLVEALEDENDNKNWLKEGF